MLGRIVALHAAPGAEIKKGDVLLVIEAMKMEQRLTAGAAGCITAVAVDEGETVDQGTTLIRMECEES